MVLIVSMLTEAAFCDENNIVKTFEISVLYVNIQCLAKVFIPLHFFIVLLCCCLMLNCFILPPPPILHHNGKEKKKLFFNIFAPLNPYLGKFKFSSGAFISLAYVTTLRVELFCGKFNLMGMIWKSTHILIKGLTAENAYQSKNQLRP